MASKIAKVVEAVETAVAGAGLGLSPVRTYLPEVDLQAVTTTPICFVRLSPTEIPQFSTSTRELRLLDVTVEVLLAAKVTRADVSAVDAIIEKLEQVDAALFAGILIEDGQRAVWVRSSITTPFGDSELTNLAIADSVLTVTLRVAVT